MRPRSYAASITPCSGLDHLFLKHVLDHASPNSNKKKHSVFNVKKSEVLGLVDEAWGKRGAPVEKDPGAFIVPMGKKVGTEGETSIKIVVKPGTNEVITAFPQN